MKVGDLIREKEYPAGVGLIVEIKDLRVKKPYRVWCRVWGEIIAFPKKYIQEECEVINESW